MRVLVVEDYPPIRESVSQGLREAGFAVDEAASGEDGLWLAQSNDYDVAVLDWMLPLVDGLTILRAIRQRGARTGILMLSARSEIEDRVAGLNEGADDYLVKPFAFAELLARVQSLVRRRYDVPDSIIQIGDLEIDTCAKVGP